MSVNTNRTDGRFTFTLVVLMAAVFTVSVGYGVVLPRLPQLIERLLAGGTEAAQVSRHTGMLTAVYTAALFMFAPMWGRLADRRGARGVLLLGLLGFGVVMMIFSLVESLAAVYAERFLSGMFAAAVSPVAAAVAGGITTTEQGRARRLAFISMASIAGFMLGPMLGVFVGRIAASFFPFTVSAGSLSIPLVATASLAFLVACGVGLAVPVSMGLGRLQKTNKPPVAPTTCLVPKLLVLTFIVSAGIGAFEVALALRGRQELGLSPYQVALMFAECGLVMFMLQAVVFSPRFTPEATRWLITPAFIVLAIGLFLVPWASDFLWMLVTTGAVAASAGVLSPILTYWISSRAGSAQGWQLGRQSAAASLGVTLGSAIGGLSYNFAGFPGAPIIFTAGLAAVGVVLSLGFPQQLAPAQIAKPSA